jgi:hypothetical protein
MKVRLDSIEISAGTQVRQSINNDTVVDYAERMMEGDVFPPVVLFHDGNAYYIGDGHHRVIASNRNEFVDIDADVRPGTQQDALWYALGANKTNALRMTPGDLRRAVALALKTWPDKTQQAIAQQVGCGVGTVNRVKQDIFQVENTELPETRTDASGRTRPTTYQKKDTLEDITETETTGEIPDETGEEEQEEETKAEKPKKTKREYEPPSIGLQYAEMAIDNLKQIAKDDCERKEAFESVVKWIKKNR